MKKFAILLALGMVLSTAYWGYTQTRIHRGSSGTTNIQGNTAEGAASLPNPILIGGDDGTDITNILVDTDGHLQIDVLSGGGISQDTDDTTTHSTGVTLVTSVGFVAVPTDTAVDANDIGMPAMSLDRRIHTDTDITANSIGLFVPADFNAAFGTAGSADSQVLSVQGIASGTVLGVGGNAGSLTVDAPVGTPVFVRLSNGSTAIDAAVLGTATYTEATTTGNLIAAVRNNDLAPLADTDNELSPLQTDALGALYVKNSDPIVAVALTELIGINEQVDASEYSASVAVTLAGTGEIIKVCLFATEDGSGAILTSNGTLLLTTADPATTAGDAAITAAERITVAFQIVFQNANWQFDATGGSNCVATADAFDDSTLFGLFFLAIGDTSWNSAAGDDEQLEVIIHYRRDS